MTKKWKIKMPFKGDFPMSQRFGVFFWMADRKLKHQGVDWAMPKGTRLLACFDGVVSRVEEFRLTGYGKSVYLRSAAGDYEALYAHMSVVFVKVGDKIKSGEMIGSSGNTGFVVGKNGGYHLHFGLKLYGAYIDPLPALTGEEAEGQLPLYEYIVKAGDTLSSIAQDFYHDGDRWPEIFNGNRDRITDSNLIFPGLILRIRGLI